MTEQLPKANKSENAFDYCYVNLATLRVCGTISGTRCFSVRVAVINEIIAQMRARCLAAAPATAQLSR